jgi:1-aminocyclopropane-1-carboxylate deaminase/D-cysteine desulfhydrase-like pyridoxal-dependent ACC family enzyme
MITAINEITLVVAAIAALGTGLNLLVNVRSQRDNAQLENRILAAINGKYISRREHEICIHEDEKWKESMEEQQSKIREQHHNLHDEFIACKSGHHGVVK